MSKTFYKQNKGEKPYFPVISPFGFLSRFWPFLCMRNSKASTKILPQIWPKNLKKSQGKGDEGICCRCQPQPAIKGPPIKTKSVTPVVGWWVRGQKRTRIFFYRVFELPSPRNAQKRDKQNREKNRFWTSGRIFCKSFSTIFFCKTFFVVFLNSHR
jgi:hypothetical protein